VQDVNNFGASLFDLKSWQILQNLSNTEVMEVLTTLVYFSCSWSCSWM